MPRTALLRGRCWELTEDLAVEMYKAVIFDFDYTLGDCTSGIVESTNYALKKLGFMSKTDSEIKHTVGLTLKEMFFSLTETHDINKAERFTKLYMEKADEVITDSTELYECVPKVLDELHKAMKIGIVTTKKHYRINDILRKFSAQGLVDLIIGIDDVKVPKPDPEGLLKMISQFGVTKRDVLYVGDSLVDAKTAQSAGVDFAAVLTGTTTDFSGYDNVFIGNNVSEVFDFVIKI